VATNLCVLASDPMGTTGETVERDEVASQNSRHHLVSRISRYFDNLKGQCDVPNLAAKCQAIPG